MLRINAVKKQMLVHRLVPAGPVPTAQQADSCYPYESFYETARRPDLKYLQFIELENDFVRITVCPDLGGKVMEIFHKGCGKNVLFIEPIVRPIRILPRQFYIGGGIEVNYPIAHSPVQTVPLDFSIKETEDRVYAYIGELEIKFGTNFTIEYSLGKDDKFLTQRTYFVNSTEKGCKWMSWSNAGIPARNDTEFHYPAGKVLEHGDELKMIDWETEGPKKNGDMHSMAGFFWREPEDGLNAFGAYTPSLGIGLYHIADPELMPGIKMWSEGVEKQKEMIQACMLEKTEFLEIQAGPLIDQGVKDVLGPGETHYHVEFWIPSDKPIDIKKLELPQVELPPLEEIPLFGYAREEEVELWLTLLDAYEKKDTELMPDAPDIDCNSWPPTGIANLDKALEWAISVTEGKEKSIWTFELGTLLAAFELTDEAIDMLRKSDDDRAHILESRLLRRTKKDIEGAYKAISRVESYVVACHPQTIFERDLVLEAMGKDKLEERGEWFRRVSSLTDEWVAERRAAYEIEMGNYEEAKDILLNANFQMIHQRYMRMPLWRKIEKALGMEPTYEINWMGEDTMAEFGAYQEYMGE